MRNQKQFESSLVDDSRQVDDLGSDSNEAVVSDDAESVKTGDHPSQIQVLPAEQPIVKPVNRRTDYSGQRYEKDAEISAAVTRLARLGLTKSAVAIACRLTPVELTKWYGDEYAAGQAGMQEVVARGLMEQAMAGNPQVLMYLGKAKLGWSEANIIEHVGTVNAVVSAKPLTREEFAQKYLNSDAEEDES